MFDTYGTIEINKQSVDIEKLSIEDLKKYSKLIDEKEKQVITKQNEYLSQLLG